MGDINPSLPQRLHTSFASSEEFDRALLRAIQEASPDGILVVDDNGLVVSYNQRFIETWGLSIEYLRENSTDDGYIDEHKLMHAALEKLKDPQAFIQRVHELYARPFEYDNCEIELNDGRFLERHSIGLHDASQHYFGRVWFFRDITERKRGEAALRDLAWRDPLTRELNRGHFMERANEELRSAQAQEVPVGLVMLDLDNFKEINDQYGHAAGDTVLQTVCKRWRSVLRSVDLLGRIGGEEFAILLPDSDEQVTLAVAERLRASIASQPICSADLNIQCTVSGGIAMATVHDKSIQSMLIRADNALYRAKHNGRNRMEAVDAGADYI